MLEFSPERSKAQMAGSNGSSGDVWDLLQEEIGDLRREIHAFRSETHTRFGRMDTHLKRMVKLISTLADRRALEGH
jgi:hypothetical protein